MQRLQRLWCLLFFSFVVWIPAALADNWDLHYGGRMTEATGAPVKGPVTLRVRFYRAETGGASLAVTPPDLTNVQLTNGLFQVTLSLSGADRQLLFNGTDPVFIEVTDVTRGVTYPRQTFGMVPYALKVPIDDKVLAYDVDGKLTLSAAPEAGKVLSANAQGELQWIMLPGGGDLVSTNNLSDLANVVTARTNLGLGNAATRDVGTGAGDVAYGNHTHADATTSAAGFLSAADKTKLDGIAAGSDNVDATTVAAAGAVMDSDFGAGTGIMVKSGATSYGTITDSSTNWNTAYTDRLKWDGAQVGSGSIFDQGTGRNALGLGTIATQNSDNVSITGGSISGVTITHADNSISGDKVDGGIISNFASTGIDDNASANAVTIDASGFVGIGVTSPSGILDVQGGTAAASFDGTDITLAAQDAGAGNQEGGNILLLPGAGTGTGFSGRVGIGTSTPNQYYLLDVNGNVRVNGELRFASGGNILGNGTGYGLQLTNASDVTVVPRSAFKGTASIGSGPAAATTVTGAHSDSATQINVGSTAGYPDSGIVRIGDELLIYSAKDPTRLFVSRGEYGTTAAAMTGGEPVNLLLATFEINTTSAPKAVIDAAGNIGIGTVKPAAALDIQAASGIRAFQICDEAGANCKDISAGWGGTGDLLAANNLSDLANTTTARSNLGLGDAATKNVGTGAGEVAAGNHTHANATDSVAGFMSASDKAKLDGFTIDSSGNLGLGDTSPDGKLSIIPGANEKGIVVSGGSLTGANTQSLVDLSTTWNTTGNTTAFKMNITNTSTGPNSRLLDLQLDNNSIFYVDRYGYVGSYAFGTIASNAGTALGGALISNTTHPSVSIGNGSNNFVGASGTWRLLRVGSANNDKFAPASGTATMIHTDIVPTVNTSGTYAGQTTALRVSQFNESTTGVSSNLLLDVGTNSALSGGGTHTSRFAVTSAGNVGIGTSGPAKKVDVRGTTATEEGIQYYDNDSGGNAFLGESYGLMGLFGGTFNPSLFISAANANATNSGYIGMYTRFAGANKGNVELTAGYWAPDSMYGKINFATGPGALTQMTIDESGEVGIGNTNPGAKLHIGSGPAIVNTAIPGGAPGLSTMLSSAADSDTVAHTIGVQANRESRASFFFRDSTPGDGSWGLWGMDATAIQQPFVIGWGTTELLRIEGSSVGIGTNMPDKPLTVSAHSAEVQPLRLHRQTSTNGGVIGLLYSANDSGAAVQSYASTSGVIESSTAGAENGAFIISTVAGGTSNERVRVTSAGNVGIGKSDPSNRLHVVDSGTSVTIRAEANVADGVATVQVADGNDAAFYTGVDGTANTMWFGNDNVNRDQLTISSTGSVGVGANNPSSKLDVNGAVTVRGMTAPTASPAGQGRIYFDSTSKKYRVSEDGGAYVDLVPASASIKTVSARITNNGTTCGIGAEIGDWIDSAARAGSGLCNLTLTSGFFSSAPACTCTVNGETGGFNSICGFLNPSDTSQLEISTEYAGNVQVDIGFEIICVGT